MIAVSPTNLNLDSYLSKKIVFLASVKALSN